MPRDHFNYDDGLPNDDQDGVELTNDSAAHVMAITFLGEMLQQQPMLLIEKGSWGVEVNSEAGAPLLSIMTKTFKSTDERTVAATLSA